MHWKRTTVSFTKKERWHNNTTYSTSIVDSLSLDPCHTEIDSCHLVLNSGWNYFGIWTLILTTSKIAQHIYQTIVASWVIGCTTIEKNESWLPGIRDAITKHPHGQCILHDARYGVETRHSYLTNLFSMSNMISQLMDNGDDMDP